MLSISQKKPGDISWQLTLEGNFDDINKDKKDCYHFYKSRAGRSVVVATFSDSLNQKIVVITKLCHKLYAFGFESNYIK